MKLKINPEIEYGVVLEGGGARGAYQVGAWKALREAGIKICGVAGTSVGALNGALMCMEQYEKAEEIWSTMDYSKIFQMDEPMARQLRKSGIKALEPADMTAELRRMIEDKGLDITPLKKLIADVVDEEKIRNSHIDLFVPSLSVTERKAVVFELKTAPEGTMKDMLLASAYMPGFKNEKLGGKTYLDGGSVNNVPVNILTERGYKNLIIIRIYGIGVDTERWFEAPEDVNILRIAPRRNLGGILEFEIPRIKRNMTLGYYDAKRALYGLAGRKYYLDMPYTEAYYFDKLMSELQTFQWYLEPYVDKEAMEAISGYRAYTEQIFPALGKKFKLPSDWNYKDLYGAILEVCAKKMSLDVFHIYTADEIVGQVYRALSEKRRIGEGADGWK